MAEEKILVTKSSLPKFEDYVEEIRDIWDTHWLTNMGVKHERFREMLSDYLEVDNVELLTNCHRALELSLQAMKFPGGA